MAKYLILNEADYEDYTDPNSCFGNKNKEVGYNPETPECKLCLKDNGPEFVNKCAKLCSGIPGVLEGTDEPEEIPVVEPVVEPKTESERERVLATVQKVCASLGRECEVVPSATRDKVFIGEDDVFVVTKRALKINRVTDGNVLGIEASYWKEDNKGITIEYENNLNYTFIVTKAMEHLYGDTPTVVEVEAPKKDLFDAPVEPVPVITEKVEPVQKVKEVVSDDYIPEAEMDKGRIVKSLHVIKYSNGYTEIRVLVQSDVAHETITKLKDFLA